MKRNWMFLGFSALLGASAFIFSSHYHSSYQNYYNKCIKAAQRTGLAMETADKVCRCFSMNMEEFGHDKSIPEQKDIASTCFDLYVSDEEE